MAVTKRELEYYLVQLRRIAEHREDGAEKEIRRIYRALLKDLKQFIGYEYAELAEDGRLTYSILQQKGEFARFLEEVEQRINNLSPQITSEITAAVEETYRIVYDGMLDAVKQNTESEGLKRALDGLRSATPETIKRAVENPVSGLTLKDTLEKNRRDIIYDIKRNVAVGLSNGDRVDTMAKRISQSLDGDYQKAVRIARTESHRVQEAGFHDSAAEVDSTLQNSDSGLRMVKTWRTMKDERVRPQRRYKTKSGWKTVRRGTANHQKMEGASVLMDEQFDLGGGVKADAPGQSGVASHDINCRCFVEYDMMTDEEFAQKTGRTSEKGFTNTEDRGIIKRKNSDLPNGLPLRDEPNSIVDKTDDFGNVQQRRVYGEDGMAKTDFDTTDHNRPDIHPTGAHKHEFDHSNKKPRGKPIPLTEQDLKDNSDIIKRGENYHDET